MSVVKGILLCCLTIACAAASAPQVQQGDLGGAQYRWLKPRQWNRRVLIIAHDFQKISSPVDADFSPEDPVYHALLDEGWVVAKTSYRRNGVILTDAMTDIDALRAEIVQQYGVPEQVLIEGQGMGGLIGLLIAEREPEDPPHYQGILAI
jgi:pimeloyl-ACP methyl ester carboxylesterase